MEKRSYFCYWAPNKKKFCNKIIKVFGINKIFVTFVSFAICLGICVTPDLNKLQLLVASKVVYFKTFWLWVCFWLEYAMPNAGYNQKKIIFFHHLFNSFWRQLLKTSINDIFCTAARCNNLAVGLANAIWNGIVLRNLILLPVLLLHNIMASCTLR